MSGGTQLPAVFWAHGNPLLTLSDNPYSRAWRALGARLQKPRAILVVSAHWVTDGVSAMSAEQPGMLHDFGGFPQVLYDLRYEPPGDPALAAWLGTHLGARTDGHRGLDHGAWTILRHMYPQADVPVVQMSLDGTLPGAAHYALGTRLRPLRADGVLIIGSGNVIHNLSLYYGHRTSRQWMQVFEDRLRTHLAHGPIQPLFEPADLGPEGALAAPTPEHYWPLLYVLGSREDNEPLSFPAAGFEGGGISMLSVLVGG